MVRLKLDNHRSNSLVKNYYERGFFWSVFDCRSDPVISPSQRIFLCWEDAGREDGPNLLFRRALPSNGMTAKLERPTRHRRTTAAQELGHLLLRQKFDF